MHLTIQTKEKILFKGEAREILQVPGLDGLFGVLSNHAPIIAAVVPGCFRVKIEDEEVAYFVGVGVFRFNSNQATLLVEAAEVAAEIDPGRARRAEERAQQRLAARGDTDLRRAEAALLRAQVRRKISSRNEA